MDYEHFMHLALKQAQKALDAGEFPVGCVMVYDNHVIASGTRTGTRKEALNEIDHAEMTALRRLAALDQQIAAEKITLFCTMEPCLMCLAAIMLSGIHKIVYAYEDVMGGCTRCDLSRLPPLYSNARMTVVAHILRTESLRLFKNYFQNPCNAYWRDSLLYQYTLKCEVPKV